MQVNCLENGFGLEVDGKNGAFKHCVEKYGGSESVVDVFKTEFKRIYGFGLGCFGKDIILAGESIAKNLLGHKFGMFTCYIPFSSIPRSANSKIQVATLQNIMLSFINRVQEEIKEDDIVVEKNPLHNEITFRFRNFCFIFPLDMVDGIRAVFHRLINGPDQFAYHDNNLYASDYALWSFANSSIICDIFNENYLTVARQCEYRELGFKIINVNYVDDCFKMNKIEYTNGCIIIDGINLPNFLKMRRCKYGYAQDDNPISFGKERLIYLKYLNYLNMVTSEDFLMSGSITNGHYPFGVKLDVYSKDYKFEEHIPDNHFTRFLFKTFIGIDLANDKDGNLLSAIYQDSIKKINPRSMDGALINYSDIIKMSTQITTNNKSYDKIFQHLSSSSSPYPDFFISLDNNITSIKNFTEKKKVEQPKAEVEKKKLEQPKEEVEKKKVEQPKEEVEKKKKEVGYDKEKEIVFSVDMFGMEKKRYEEVDCREVYGRKIKIIKIDGNYYGVINENVCFGKLIENVVHKLSASDVYTLHCYNLHALYDTIMKCHNPSDNCHICTSFTKTSIDSFFDQLTI